MTLAWDGARNLGELGGLALRDGGVTQPGRIYRSAASEWMTSRGWAHARRLGVGTIIDLRNERERGRTEIHPVVPAGATAGVAFVHAPTEDPDDPEFLAECGPWLDHPRSWDGNLRLYPEKIVRVLDAVVSADGPVLIHCAGGRDRTGMIGSLLLMLAGAAPSAIVANYEDGFRGAAAHRGHGMSYDPAVGEWVTTTDREWTADELDAALADRRPVLLAWAQEFDAEGYLRDAGMDSSSIERLRSLLR